MGSPDVVVAAADRALYGAKERGRNQIVRATAPGPRPAATRTDERGAPALPTDLEGCRVLVVDDDDLTLRATTRALQRLGCDVLATSSSRGALTTLANDPSVRVLVTDIIMPDLSGFTLADLAGKSHPGLPVLYVSGYPPEEVYWGGTPGGRSAFLGKPLDAGELRDALLRLLGSAPNAAGAEAETPPVAPEARSEGPARGRADAVPTPTRPGRVLIVDDNPAVVAALQRYLHSAGYARPLGITDPREVVETLRTRDVDLMVLDFAMGAMDGVEVLKAISGLVDEEEFFPVVMLTGEGDPEVRRRALEAGAMDFLDKPFDPIEVEVRIRNLLTTRFLTQRVARQRDTLEDEVAARTAELADTRSEILYRLARAAEYRDDVTGRHAERVGLLSSAVASALGLAPRDVDLLRRTAPLHDIGKIGVPDSILLKASGLSDAEFEVMKSHTTIGAQILGGSSHRILEVAQAIALHHHERWDGEGYPDGLVGAQTPLEARIVAVADSFDTITHARSYKAALSPAEGLDEIERCSGTWYDPDVVTGLRLVKDRVGLEHLHELAAPLDPLRDTQKDNLAAGRHTGGRVGK
jgi:putative two-component system response regulator